MLIHTQENNGTRFTVTRDEDGRFVVDYVCIAHPDLNDIEVFDGVEEALAQVSERLDEDFYWEKYL